MRVILVGEEEGERDRLRWQLEGTSITVVGECASVNEARASGIEADALMVAARSSHPARTAIGVDERHARSSAALDLSHADRLESLEAFEMLTPREIQVLELLAEGLPNKAIAGRLGISDQTVKVHVASISGKLGASNRTDAVRRGVRRGLITL
jgi:DNA-binding NarL/FixJ family response regulator